MRARQREGFMEMKRWYAEVLMKATMIPDLEDNASFQHSKERVRDALEGDAEYSYGKVSRDLKFMNSFLV